MNNNFSFDCIETMTMPFINEDMLKKSIAVAKDRYSYLSDLTTSLGIEPDSQLKALNDGYPREAALQSGIGLEKLLHMMWRYYLPDREPNDDQSFTLIKGLADFISNDKVVNYMNSIRITRNRASHVGEGVSVDDAVEVVCKLIFILEWYKNIQPGQAELILDDSEEQNNHSISYEIQIIDMMQSSNSLDLRHCVEKANQIQDQLVFNIIDDPLSHEIKFKTFNGEIEISSYLNMMEEVRSKQNRHKNRLIVFLDNYLIGTVYENLFAGRRPENGLGVITTHDVEDVVIPAGNMSAYFMYMLARSALDSMAPTHEYHFDEERNYCVFDYKVNKQDIILSMRSRALCDECRFKLIDGINEVNPARYNAIDKLLEYSGILLRNEDD